MSKVAFKKHEEALKALGLVTDAGEPTWFTEGKPDLIKMMDIAGSHAANIPLSMRAGYEKQLFGTQGFGGFALLADPAVRQQIAALNKDMNSPEFRNRYAGFMENYAANSPMQAGRVTWADLNNVLMDIGRVALPEVVNLLRGFDWYLKALPAAFNAIEKATVGIPAAAASAAASLRGLSGSPPFGRSPSIPGSQGPIPLLPHIGPNIPPVGSKSSMNETPPMHIKTAVYLDGRIIGETMSSELARLSTFPRQAAYGDSYGAWSPPDYNFATG